MKDKMQILEKYFLENIIDKKVLDIGFGGNNGSLDSKPMKMIREYTEKYTGIDIKEENINNAKKLGINVSLADVENFNLKHKFDTVIMFDVIEHLSNPGNALSCISKHMHKESFLIINTPNPFYLFGLGRYFHLWRGVNNINLEHTCWFCPITLRQLLNRHGFSFELFSKPLGQEILCVCRKEE